MGPPLPFAEHEDLRRKAKRQGKPNRPAGDVAAAKPARRIAADMRKAATTRAMGQQLMPLRRLWDVAAQ